MAIRPSIRTLGLLDTVGYIAGWLPGDVTASTDGQAAAAVLLVRREVSLSPVYGRGWMSGCRRHQRRTTVKPSERFGDG